MSGLGNTDPKGSKRHHTENYSLEKMSKLMEKPGWNKHVSKEPNAKSKFGESHKFDPIVKVRKSQTTKSKYGALTGNPNDSEQVETIGETFSDSLASMRRYPALNPYNEFDVKSRSYRWQAYLENLGGKYEK